MSWMFIITPMKLNVYPNNSCSKFNTQSAFHYNKISLFKRDLSYNEITSLPDGVFATLTSLQKL